LELQFSSDAIFWSLPFFSPDFLALVPDLSQFGAVLLSFFALFVLFAVWGWVVFFCLFVWGVCVFV